MVVKKTEVINREKHTLPQDNGQAKALETALANLKKRFGDTAIMKLGEAQHLQVESISTGSLSLDLALGVGGVPKGRVIEIYGPESSGKTTLTLHIIAELQTASIQTFTTGSVCK